MLKYTDDYRNFRTVIGKVKIVGENSGEFIPNHFVHVAEMVKNKMMADPTIQMDFPRQHSMPVLVSFVTVLQLTITYLNK